jgi:hypothetical protein
LPIVRRKLGPPAAASGLAIAWATRGGVVWRGIDPQRNADDGTVPIESNDVERILADIDPDKGD